VKADPNLQYVVAFISIENICDIFQYRTVLGWLARTSGFGFRKEIIV
jgi:hypothetical protein